MALCKSTRAGIGYSRLAVINLATSLPAKWRFNEDAADDNCTDREEILFEGMRIVVYRRVGRSSRVAAQN